MWETIIEMLFYLVAGLACLGTVVWAAATGQFFSLDGLFLILVCLTLAAVLLVAFALGLHSGDFQEVLSRLRSGATEREAQPTAPTASKTGESVTVPGSGE